MYTSSLLAGQAGIVHGFSDVTDGNMAYRFGDPKAILANRIKFLQPLGLTPDRCVQQFGFTETIHVTTKAEAGRGMREPESAIEASAFITNQPGLGLFLTIADCLPVLIYDPVQSVIALIHASRAATNQLVPARTVERLRTEFHCRATDLFVALGPSVRSESYIYDRNIYNLITPAFRPFLHEQSPDHIEVDNVGYARHQLVAAGIPEANINDSRIDTGRNPHYFSHVHALHARQPEGRLAAVIALR